MVQESRSSQIIYSRCHSSHYENQNVLPHEVWNSVSYENSFFISRSCSAGQATGCSDKPFMRRVHADITENSQSYGSREELLLLLLCAAPRDSPGKHNRLAEQLAEEAASSQPKMYACLCPIPRIKSRLVNIDGLDPYTSTISVVIRTIPRSLANDSFVWGN